MRENTVPFHVGMETMKKLKENRLGAEETLRALAHIQSCDQCADLFAGSFTGEDLLKPAPDFASRVLLRAEKPYVTVTPLDAFEAKPKRNIKNPKKEYRMYQIKVGLAACVAILLMFSGMFQGSLEKVQDSQVVNRDFSGVESITERLKDFSDSLINWEVRNYDKEEK